MGKLQRICRRPTSLPSHSPEPARSATIHVVWLRVSSPTSHQWPVKQIVSFFASSAESVGRFCHMRRFGHWISRGFESIPECENVAHESLGLACGTISPMAPPTWWRTDAHCMHDNPIGFRLFLLPFTCPAIPQKIPTFKAHSRKAHFRPTDSAEDPILETFFAQLDSAALLTLRGAFPVSMGLATNELYGSKSGRCSMHTSGGKGDFHQSSDSPPVTDLSQITWNHVQKPLQYRKCGIRKASTVSKASSNPSAQGIAQEQAYSGKGWRWKVG